MTAFLKMHGLGNDFAVFDARESILSFSEERARHLGDRHRGIGFDQLIVIESGQNGFDAFMRILNADGGEVESCGNAARCVARLLMEEKDADHVCILTRGGPLDCFSAGSAVTVDMGLPRADWREIPMSQAVDTDSFALPLGAIYEPLGEAMAVSMGNPHCVLFVKDAETAPVAELGPKIEHHPWFPERANVEFVQRLSESALRMRVWERGAGITLACGTGACASAVASARRGLTGRKVRLELDGGALDIEWREADDHVLMTGPVALSYRGEIDLEAFA